MKWTNPFDELSEMDQKTAIDLGVAASLIVTRLPAISELVFDAISREFSDCYGVRENIAKYSLRAVGRTLFHTQWSCTITKDGAGNIATHFQQDLGELGRAGDRLNGQDGD